VIGRGILLGAEFRKFRYRCAWAMYATIVLMGSVPGVRADIGDYAPGFVLHSIAYTILTFLLFSGGTGHARQRAVKAVLTVMAMGAVDEFVQSFLPYRRADVTDWLVDSGASIVTSALLWAFLPDRHSSCSRRTEDMA
jgi:VanZ family protein